MGKILKVSNLRKTWNYLKKNGIKQAYYAIRERVGQEKAEEYSYLPLTEEELAVQRKKGAGYTTKFSILVPTYETKEEYLREMIDSVLAQTYEKFELILADASSSDCVEDIVKTYEDKRILYRRLKRNGGISANTNQALMYATGDYAGLLDHDDMLTPDALYEMAVCIDEYERKNIELQLLYSDEDKCDGTGERFFEVHKKEEFNLDLIMSNNYICHFMVMKRGLMQELGFRSICDGAQDFDIMLRAVNHMMGKEKSQTISRELPIAHIDKVLYHWRCHEQSTAENPASKQYAYDAGKRAVEDFIRARGWKGTVSHIRHLGFYRTDYQPDVFSNRPDVAVVGGKLLDKRNRITGGIYEAPGEALYYGLHKEFSGYMHKASLQQEAQVVDIRCMKVSLEAEEILEEIIGLPYMKHPKTGRFDWKACLKADVDYLAISRKFCEKVREKGYRIVWDPDMHEKL